MLFDADGGLLYVGQSLNIGYRIVQHRWAARRGERLGFTHFSALDVPVNLMRHIECAHTHSPAAMSNSAQRAPRTSPGRVAVSITIRRACTVWGSPW